MIKNTGALSYMNLMNAINHIGGSKFILTAQFHLCTIAKEIVLGAPVEIIYNVSYNENVPTEWLLVGVNKDNKVIEYYSTGDDSKL